MKKHYWLAVMAAAGLFLSCNKDDNDPSEPDTFYGNTVTIGKGTGRSFIKNTKNHAALEFGLELTPGALEGLDDHNELEFVLDLPGQAKELTPFDHITLGWMPHGHKIPVFAKPHFDVHFYMIPRAEEQAIDTGAAMMKDPPTGFLPPSFVPEPGPGVPKMGRHWIDINALGQPFTSVFIIGSFDAKVIFWEPMITTEFLSSKPDIDFDIPQPTKVAEENHYPTKYGIHFDKEKQKFIILLSAFKHL